MIRYCIEVVGKGTAPDRLLPMTDRFTAQREYAKLVQTGEHLRLYRCEVVNESNPKE